MQATHPLLTAIADAKRKPLTANTMALLVDRIAFDRKAKA